jgi:hypothetical protein
MKRFPYFLSLLFASSLALASPGAHGPNGEHLEAPGSHVHNDAGPRIETFTEAFELVGHLQDGELSVLIDRYETNEPVLNGTLEVEFNGIKAPARFHADHGDYAVNDAKFLEALSRPGKHSLIFTLTAGEESDLLEGALEVSATNAEHGHAHVEAHAPGALKTWAIGGSLLAALLAVIVVAMIRRKSKSGISS